MSKTLHRLSAKTVENAKPGSSHNDGGGLFLRVGANGNKFWVYRYKLKGLSQRNMGLGAFPNISLAQARQKASVARDLLSRGFDPIEEAEKLAEEARAKSEAEKALKLTFGEYAQEVFLPAVLPEFTNAAHIQQWESTFRTHTAAINDKPLVSITREDVLEEVLRPIWDTKNETASRVRQRVERLFDYARQNGAFTGDNPASKGQFNYTLKKPKHRAQRHHASIPAENLSDFSGSLRQYQESSMAAYMLEWIILSACRTGEARFATWGEVDLERKVWEIPAERMKMKRPHVVPITERMEEILRLISPIGITEHDEDEYLFPGRARGGELSEMAAMMLMRRMGYDGYTVHGMRASFKGWAFTQTEYARELIEEQLAHQLGAVERAYLRVSAHERRRAMMEDWAKAIAPENGRECNIA